MSNRLESENSSKNSPSYEFAISLLSGKLKVKPRPIRQLLEKKGGIINKLIPIAVLLLALAGINSSLPFLPDAISKPTSPQNPLEENSSYSFSTEPDLEISLFSDSNLDNLDDISLSPDSSPHISFPSTIENPIVFEKLPSPIKKEIEEQYSPEIGTLIEKILLAPYSPENEFYAKNEKDFDINEELKQALINFRNINPVEAQKLSQLYKEFILKANGEKARRFLLLSAFLTSSSDDLKEIFETYKKYLEAQENPAEEKINPSSENESGKNNNPSKLKLKKIFETYKKYLEAQENPAEEKINPSSTNESGKNNNPSESIDYGLDKRIIIKVGLAWSPELIAQTLQEAFEILDLSQQQIPPKIIYQVTSCLSLGMADLCQIKNINDEIRNINDDGRETFVVVPPGTLSPGNNIELQSLAKIIERILR